ncbi:hypothetical protein BKK79_04785 [Cupriavidus sp. USMAA2-4]|nr:hypothetical protein BKK79_04785 [Cupriavidus sp. USMAA2-4]
MFGALPSSMPQARAGKLHALAILDATRFPLMPEVPTLRELGFNDTEASAWFGVVAPARTPRAIGAQPMMPGSPEAFGRFVEDERALDPGRQGARGQGGMSGARTATVTVYDRLTDKGVEVWTTC